MGATWDPLAAPAKGKNGALTITPHVGQVDMRTLMTTLVVKLDMMILGLAANTAVQEQVLAQLAKLDELSAITAQLAAAVTQLEAIKLPPFLTRK